MANPLLTINQPRDVDLGQDGTIRLGIRWAADLSGRFTAGFEQLQKETDAEFIRLVTPYVPLRTGALANSANTHGTGQRRDPTRHPLCGCPVLPPATGARRPRGWPRPSLG